MTVYNAHKAFHAIICLFGEKEAYTFSLPSLLILLLVSPVGCVSELVMVPQVAFEGMHASFCQGSGYVMCVLSEQRFRGPDYVM